MSEADEKSVKIDLEDEMDESGDDERSNANEEESTDTASVVSKSKTAPPSANSNKTNLSRKSSAKSQKSVAWSTGASSEKELLDEQDDKKENKNAILGIISGTNKT